MFKGISPQVSIFSFFVAVFIVALVPYSNARAQGQNDVPPGAVDMGAYFTTYYYVPDESQYPATEDTVIKDLGGKTLSKVNSAFKKDLDIEGTGILRDGKTVNYVGRVAGEIRYRVSSAKYGYGVGLCELQPYKTIAVDPAIIPLGSTVFIPAVQGLKLPDGTIHDGMFAAVDIGSKILHKHIDLFAAEGLRSGKLYEASGIQTGAYVEVYKVKDPVPGGCQDQSIESPTVPTLKQEAYNASKIKALVGLADEYAALHQSPQLQLSLRLLHQLRDGWEKDGETEIDDLPVAESVTTIASQERAWIQSRIAANSASARAEKFIPAVFSRYPREFDGTTLKPGEVVITFDDGPNPHLTPEVHATIKRLGIQAAFFEVGANVAAYGDQTKALFADGYIIGNHSYDHPHLTKLTDAEVSAQIDKTQNIITETLGGPGALDQIFQTLFANLFQYSRQVAAPEFFRSPYGDRDPRTMGLIAKTITGSSIVNGMTAGDSFYHVLWNIDSLDWNDHDPASIEKRVFDQLATENRHGVILMHDIHPQTIVAIQSILPRLQKEGYKLLNLYEMVTEAAEATPELELSGNP